MDETPETTGSSFKGQTPDLSKLKSKAKETAASFKENGKQQITQRLEEQKSTVAEQVEHLADAVNRASDELHQHEQSNLADYASQLAGTINRFAENLRTRNINDLLDDTQRLARSNPTLFFLGSIGVGIALSRFMKASAERQQQLYGSGASGSDYDVSYGSGSEWAGSSATTTGQSGYGSPAYGASQAGYGDEASLSAYRNQTSGDGDIEIREGRSSQVDDFTSGTSTGTSSSDTRRDL